jgi:hypothetical protein
MWRVEEMPTSSMYSPSSPRASSPPKFGKHEAEGRGFRPVMAEALSRGVPVLVGLNRLNAGAFHEFAGGVAVELPPSLPALMGWFETCREDVAA